MPIEWSSFVHFNADSPYLSVSANFIFNILYSYHISHWRSEESRLDPRVNNNAIIKRYSMEIKKFPSYQSFSIVLMTLMSYCFEPLKVLLGSTESDAKFYESEIV